MLGNFRNTRRISTHIGNQTNGAATTDVDAFIKLLSNHHRLLSSEFQIVVCDLLHR